MTQGLPETPKPDAGSAYRKLRKRLRRFVEAYVELGVGAQAMRRIGYEGPRPDAAAYKLLQKPEVKEAIEEYEALVVGESRKRIFRTIRQLEMIEGFDPRRMLDENGLYLPMDQWPDDVASAICGIEVEELFEGRGEDRRHIGRVKKYRVSSKIEAAKLRLQWLRQLSERHEVTGKDGAPLPGTTVYMVQKDEADKIGRDLEDKV